MANIGSYIIGSITNVQNISYFKEKRLFFTFVSIYICILYVLVSFRIFRTRGV